MLQLRMSRKVVMYSLSIQLDGRNYICGLPLRNICKEEHLQNMTSSFSEHQSIPQKAINYKLCLCTLHTRGISELSRPFEVRSQWLYTISMRTAHLWHHRVASAPPGEFSVTVHHIHAHCMLTVSPSCFAALLWQHLVFLPSTFTLGTLFPLQGYIQS